MILCVTPVLINNLKHKEAFFATAKNIWCDTQGFKINFQRCQRFHTSCICISNHSHFILSKKSKTFMCKLWLHSKPWLKRTEKSQSSTTFEDNFNLKHWVSHQMFFPVAKNASLYFKLFIKSGVTHNIIYLRVVPKFCLLSEFLGLFHEIQTLEINFQKSQRFNTSCIYISNPSHFILSKKQKKSFENFEFF